MSVASLKKKVDNLGKQIALPHTLIIEDFNFSGVFSPDECTRFTFLLHSLPRDTRLLLEEVHPSMLSEFFIFMRLYKALINGDTERISGYRYRLTFSAEDIIQLYLSLSASERTDEDLQQYSPYGRYYSVYAQAFRGQSYTVHQLDQAWDWLINANVVEDTYHSNLELTVEYRRPYWSPKEPW